MIRPIILTISFLISNLLIAQSDFKPGFIITNELDTIWGSGNISKTQDYCIFQPHNNPEFKKHLPNELYGFRVLNGKYFVSKDIIELKEKRGLFKEDTVIQIHKWYFLEYLVDGEIDLFVLREKSSERFFIEKEGLPLRELIYDKNQIINVDNNDYYHANKEYIGILKVYMKDSPKSYSEIDRLESLEQKKLTKLVENYHYNVCDTVTCIKYTKSIPKIALKIEPFSGFNYHNSFYTPHYGLFLNIWRPLRNEHLYFKIGLLYSAQPYSFSSDSIQNPNPKKIIKIPFYWQYVYGNGKLKPTIGIGFITGNFISSLQLGLQYEITDKIELSLNGSIDGLFATMTNHQKELFNNKLGHSISLGCLVQLRKK